MIAFIHPLPQAQPAYVQVQATAQPAGKGTQPYDPSPASPNSAAAGAPRTPPVTGQVVAPNAGAAGQSEAARSSAAPSGRVAAASDNGGNRASAATRAWSTGRPSAAR